MGSNSTSLPVVEVFPERILFLFVVEEGEDMLEMSSLFPCVFSHWPGHGEEWFVVFSSQEKIRSLDKREMSGWSSDAELDGCG